MPSWFDSNFPSICSAGSLVDNWKPPPVIHRPLMHRGPDTILAARMVTEAAVPPPPEIDYTSLLPSFLKIRVARYAVSTPSDSAALAGLNRAWREAGICAVSCAVLVPHYTDAQNLDAALSSLSVFFAERTRGQHLKELELVDHRYVYSLEQTMKGPMVTWDRLASLLNGCGNLRRLDIRGIVLTNLNALNDDILLFISSALPCLEVLKVGVAVVRRKWTPMWWTRTTYLTEFTCGSRREDCDWLDENALLTLPEDFFAMLRSPSHTWSAVKIWCPITPHSFTALLVPTTPFPRLMHLTVNVKGNTAIATVDPVLDTSRDDKKKAADKNQRKTTEEGITCRRPFPALCSITIVDVDERPEFAVEFRARLLAEQSLKLETFSVTNTHREAPTHAPLAQKKTKIRNIEA